MSDTGAYGDATYGDFTYGSFPSGVPSGGTGPTFFLVPLLEFSSDPLSDTTPAWHNITTDLIEIEWWAGKSNELGDPEPGGMRALLVNRGRRYEPEYEAGIYYPNIDTERRLRLTLTDDGGSVQQGLWYAESWEIDYPTGEEFSLVTVTGVDGFGLLTNDRLAFLDPPDATAYSDVVDFDQPSLYYRLGEPEGTRSSAHIRKVRWSIGGGTGRTVTRRRREGATYRTRAEVEGVSGPTGTYRNTPKLGEPGAIIGDPDTCVRFNASEGEFAKIILEETNPLGSGGSVTGCSDLTDQNKLTLEAWVWPVSDTGSVQTIIAGPGLSGGGAPVFALRITSPGDAFASAILFKNGTASTVSATGDPFESRWYHVLSTWDGQTHRIYVDGILSGTANPGSHELRPGGTVTGDRPWVLIGETTESGASGYFNGWIDEVAIYERVLGQSRITAHYQAGRERGFPQQMSGDRIESITTSPLWSTALVTTGNFELQPLMMTGQGKLDAILEAVAAERPRSFFFFNGDGDPVFRGFRAGDGTGVAVTFGDIQSETRYSAIAPIYDNEVFNKVVGSIDGGELQEATDAASILARKDRVREDEISMPLADPDDVEAVISYIAAEYSSPTQRFASVSVVGADIGRLSHLLRRGIGDIARVKRRGEGGAPIYRQATILGYRKHLDARSRLLSCQYDLARGFNAATSGWRLGSAGFSELGTNTRLG